MVEKIPQQKTDKGGASLPTRFHERRQMVAYVADQYKLVRAVDRWIFVTVLISPPIHRHSPTTHSKFRASQATRSAWTLEGMIRGKIRGIGDVGKAMRMNRPRLLKTVGSIEGTLQRVVLGNRSIRINHNNPKISCSQPFFHSSAAQNQLDHVVKQPGYGPESGRRGRHPKAGRATARIPQIGTRLYRMAVASDCRRDTRNPHSGRPIP